MTKQNLEAQYFLSGSGYTNAYEYLVHEIQGYTFYLNEFADLKTLIPFEEKNSQFKVRLSFSRIFDQANSSTVENAYEIKEKKLLGQLVGVPNGNSNVETEPIEAHYYSYVVTLIGYCTDSETKTMTLLMHNFAQKFKK